MNPFTPKAEFIWYSIPEVLRVAILRNVWCGKCRTAVEIVDYTGKDVGRDIVLEGRCAVCGGRVARHVEAVRGKIAPK